MHIKESKITAILDGELGTAETFELEQHLDSCSHCTERVQVAQDLREQTTGLLDRLASQSPPKHTTHQARQRLALRQNFQETHKMKSPVTKLFNRRTLAAVTAALALVIVFSFPAVQAAAANFLGLFRVQQIAVVQFDPANLGNGVNSNAINVEQLLADQVTYSEPGEPLEVTTPDEAEANVAFDVRWPASGAEASRITVQEAGWIELEIDLAQVELLLNDLGESDLVLPASVDGEVARFDFPQSVTGVLGPCSLESSDRPESRGAERCTVFVQMPSPTITAPPELPVQDIGRTFLQLLGMSEADAQAFSNQIDWATTLVIPVPSDFDYQKVSVDGVEGTLFQQSQDAEEGLYSLIWIRDGVVYALSGVGSLGEALDIANSLQ
jgi:anti-sigma factor RsiW